jgi:hypothetical protein
MRATQTLPNTYRKIGTLDVSASERLLLILNLAGLLMLAASGWLFFRAAIWLRATDAARAIQILQISTLPGWIGLIAAILALTALHIILHEAIHGVFFWVFTRSRPRFAFRWAYAYAAAPGWYIPRNPFFITTLAPLVVITLVGLLIFAAAPLGWLLPTWLVITMNAGGAVGDLAVALWLLRQPATCLAQDRGDAVTLFVPVKTAD